MKELKLKNSSLIVIVDDEDFERLSQFKWYKRSDNSIGMAFYENRKTINVSIANEVMQNRLVMYDHKDRNFLNNQKLNLREANNSQNAANRSKILYTRYQYKGISRQRGRFVYRAMIKTKGKKYHLGYFDTQEEAAKAYDKKALELFGEFASLNFPVEK